MGTCFSHLWPYRPQSITFSPFPTISHATAYAIHGLWVPLSSSWISPICATTDAFALVAWNASEHAHGYGHGYGNGYGDGNGHARVWSRTPNRTGLFLWSLDAITLRRGLWSSIESISPDADGHESRYAWNAYAYGDVTVLLWRSTTIHTRYAQLFDPLLRVELESTDSYFYRHLTRSITYKFDSQSRT
jgi:hypothetical protein